MSDSFEDRVEAELLRAGEPRALAAPTPSSSLGGDDAAQMQGEWDKRIAEEKVCTATAMSQWERSLKRPDLAEKDRVLGAIEAYKRQAFAFAILPKDSPVSIVSGSVTVPIEPTAEMLERGVGAVCSLTQHGARAVYQSMIRQPADTDHPDNSCLFDATAPMADGGETLMTAAEEVLVWLLIEKIGVPDDVSYSPQKAQDIIAAYIARGKELEQIDAMLMEEGDDEGSAIMPDFFPGCSVYGKVEACLHLLERRRDVIEGYAAAVTATEDK